MNYAGKFGSGGLESLSHAQIDFDSLSPQEHADHFTVPDAHLLFSGDYHRSGQDLIISDHAHRVVVPNYFHGDKRPTLVSPDGAPFDAKVVEALTGYTQYAQAGDPPAAKVVGHVAQMTGSASIIRNGVSIVVQAGDAVYQSDVVQTGSNSTLGLVLSDGTTFNLSANARLMLNDLTYDATSTSNSALITLVQGAASFVAGQVAKTGDMKVATPVATMGIRGTAVTLEISSTDGSVAISVIDQRDGLVHAVEAFDSKGNLIGLITSNGGSLTLTPTASFEVIAQQSNKTPAQIAEEFSKYQAALATYDIRKAIDPGLPQHSDAGNPNPQQTKTAGSSVTPTGPTPTYNEPVGGDTKNPLGNGPPTNPNGNQPDDPGPGGTQIGQAPIDIPVVKHAPVVTGTVTAAVTEDGSPSVLNPLANASDSDGDVLQLTIPFELPAGVSYNPALQLFTLNSNVPAYQHLAAGETTTVTVNYQISDGSVTVPGSVSWTVTGVNDAPVATPVTLEAGTEGETYTIDESDLLAGVTDVDNGAQLSITSVSVATGGGTLVDNGDGTWTYTPPYNSSGPVSFNYTASDGSLTSSSTASLTLEESSETVLTFDDLPSASGSGNPIPNGYGGLNWSNFYYLNGSHFPGSGYDNGTVSGLNVAYNAFGNLASVSGETFDFVGADFTGAWNNGLSINVKGYDGNELKYDITYVVTSTEPTWLQFNFDDVTNIVFTSFGGTSAGLGGNGTHFAMDNFTFSMGNDSADITGKSSASLVEDAPPTDNSGTIVTHDTDSGTLTVHDADEGEDHFRTVAAPDLDGDYGKFTFNADTGQWTYTLDHDKTQALSANQVVHDTLTVTSFDGTASRIIDITVTGTNDAPDFTGQGPTSTYTPGDAAVSLATDVSASDVDSADYDGGSLTATVTDGAHEGDTLSIAPTTFISTISGSMVMFDADGDGEGQAVQIGTLSSEGTSLTVTLNAHADNAAVEALTEAIRFETSDQSGTDRTVTFTLNDGDGIAHGGHDFDRFDVTVDVPPPPNVAPLIVTDNLQLDEDGETTTVRGLSILDADAKSGETFTISAVTAEEGSSVELPTDSGTLGAINEALLGNGVIYDPGSEPPATDKVSFTVTDGSGATDTVNFIFVGAEQGEYVTLEGTEGKDVILASGHTDTLTGGSSADQFVFGFGSGNDTITDFRPGEDKIDLYGYLPFIPDDADSFQAWIENASEPFASGTLIHLAGNDDTIHLSHVSRDSLSINDFILHPGR